MASPSAFEPRTHLKETSALTNAPPLLPLFLSILAGNQPLHAVYLGILQVCRTDNVSESEIKLIVVGVVRTCMSRQQHRVQDLHCGLSRQRCKSVLVSVYPIPISCSRFSDSGGQEKIWRYGLGMAMELLVTLLVNKFKSKPDEPFSTCPRLT